MFQNLIKSLFRRENLPILIILLIAAFFRFYHISEYLTFLGDEGRDVLVAKHILDGNLTLLGPTASVGGFFLGPIYYYMMAPFLLLFNFDPVGPAVMVALFGIATVWLVYKVTKDFFGYLPALAASLLYAISPLVITYSRSSWNPNTVPFFSLLMLYLVYQGIIKKSWMRILVAGILFGILLQLHYLATFLGVVVFFYILISTIYQDKKFAKSSLHVLMRYIWFAVGTLVGWSPFLAFEVRHGFPNIQSIFKFVFTSGQTGNNDKYFQIVVDVFLRLFGRLLLAFPPVENLHFYLPSVLLVWGAVANLIGICAIVFCIVKLVLSIKHKNNSFYQYLLLLIWILSGVLLFGFYKKPIYDYYFGFMFPLPFILLGGLASYLFARGKMVLGITLVGLLGMVVLNVYLRPIYFPEDLFINNPSVYKVFARSGIYPPNQQLKQVRDIANFVLSKTDEKPFNFAVISSGGNSDYAYRYFFETDNRTPVTIQFPGADPERKTVTDQLLIVCESVPCQPLGYSLWEVAGFGQADIAGQWPVSVVRVYRLVHHKGK